MPVISLPIKSDELPNDIELLKETIVTMEYVNKSVIGARDNHVQNLLAKVLWLEGRLKWTEDRLAAATGPARRFRTPSTAAESIRTPPSRSPTPPSLYSPFYSPGYGPPILPSVEEEETAKFTPFYSPGYNPLILPSVEEEEIANKETSPAGSTRSQTSAPSRVSKRSKVGKRSSKGVNNGRRDSVRRWSESDRFDCG